MSDQIQDVPNWKRDFPVNTDEATHVSRREFAKFLVLLSGGLALGNGLVLADGLINPKQILEEEHFVATIDEIPIGGMKQFNLEGIPYILIHLSEDEWRSFEQKCTHLSCAVRYREDVNQIECPCHNGWFSADNGAVLKGPPPRALPQLRVIVREERVYVTGYVPNNT